MRGIINFGQRSLVLTLVGVFCLMISFEGLMAAEKFPEKPIKFLVGFSPGGSGELTARMLGSLVAESLGQPVVVVCKPGASGTIAAAELAGSKPDGYVLEIITPLTLVLAPLIIPVKYDPLKDIEPLLFVSSCGALGICVRSNEPWNSFQELIEFARKNPGELTMSTPGTATGQHIAFELIARQEKISWKHVPYPGGAPASTALLGGHVKATFGGGSHLPYVESGNFKLLAINSYRRSTRFPAAPTLKELGYSDIPVSDGYFIAAPKGVPEPVLKTLMDAFKKAAQGATFKEFLKMSFFEPDIKDREDVKKLIETEYMQWNAIVEKLDLKRKEK